MQFIMPRCSALRIFAFLSTLVCCMALSLHVNRTSSGSRPVIVIGLGAQKGGTTYFTSVMHKFGTVHHGPKKELHYLDTKNNDNTEKARCRGQNVWSASGCDGCGDKVPDGAGEATGEDFFKTYMCACWSCKVPPAGHAFIDFTPHYGSTLSCVGDYPEVLSRADILIKRLQSLSKRADLRFVMALRDPVERVNSAINMYLDPSVLASPFLENVTDEQVSAYIQERMKTEDWTRFICGGKYHRVIQRLLGSGFSKHQMYVFDTNRLHKIETFQEAFAHIGIPAPPTEEIRHALSQSRASFPHKYMLPADLKKKLKAHYKHHDDALRELLPYTSDWW